MQQFAWDLLPFDDDGLRLLNSEISVSLQARDFVAFGRDVLAPTDGRIVRVVDGHADLERVGVYPEDTDYYRADAQRAAGNHVIMDRGNGIYSCLAHLQQNSILVREQQHVATGQTLGKLGNSGFSSGPHLHLHFMDNSDLRAASPLPIALQVEGQALVPQAGDIIAQ